MTARSNNGLPAWRVRLAWTLGAAITVTAATGVALWLRSGLTPPPQIFFLTSIPFVLSVVMLATQGSASVLLAVRRPGNSVGWTIMAFAAILAGVVLANGYLALSESGWTGPIDPAWVAVLTSAGSIGPGVAISVVLGMIFPDGRLLSRRWRWGVFVAFLGGLVFAWGTLLTPGPVVVFPTYINPVALAVDPTLASLARVLVGPVLLLSASAATGAALAIRYLRADEVGRLQVRWYVVSGIAIVVGLAAYIAAVLTLPPESDIGQLITIGFYIAIAIPPFALAFAILRYRLYDIDTLIGRAVVYSALTAILAGIYTASIRLFNALFVGVTGENSELALVLTTLILATTFTPIKGRLERAVAGRVEERPDRGDDPADKDGIPVAASALFADPAFAAALDDRIRAVVAETSAPAGPLDSTSDEKAASGISSAESAASERGSPSSAT
ncbi:MAG: hypothetical protein ABWY52_02240 [Candidatus Limnocylindrales bacterium]